jgi:hypothetical protein
LTELRRSNTLRQISLALRDCLASILSYQRKSDEDQSQGRKNGQFSLAFSARPLWRSLVTACQYGAKGMKFKRFSGQNSMQKSKIRMYNSPTSRMRL